MTSTLTKGGIALVGVGSVGAGGWAISSYLKSKNDTIKTILKSKGYKLTSELPENKRQDAWDKVSKTYALEVNNDLKIKVGNVTAQEIRNWCLKNIESKNGDSLLQKTEKWCTIYPSIGDQLTKDGLALEGEETTLGTKYSQLSDSIKGEIDSFAAEVGKDSNGSKLKKWCESRIYKTYVTGDFYNTFKEKCTKAAKDAE